MPWCRALRLDGHPCLHQVRREGDVCPQHERIRYEARVEERRRQVAAISTITVPRVVDASDREQVFREASLGFVADPETFPWATCDEDGTTAAHVAAREGNLPHLPPDWPGWSWLDSHGNSVALLAAASGCIPRYPPDWPGWADRNPHGVTPAHAATQWTHLCDFPPTWQGWTWADDQGRTVLHEAAKWGTITPDSFPRDWPAWQMKDNQGRTALEVAIATDSWRRS